MANGSTLPESAGTSTQDAPLESVLPRESLVVLTADEALVAILGGLRTEHELLSVGAESDLAERLVAGHTGVVVLDATAATSPLAQLIGHLKAQFPDLVLIVAGGADHQNTLATQITNGAVYRFLHKPVSEQRVRLFVEAAWRRHHAATAARSDSEPARTASAALRWANTTRGGNPTRWHNATKVLGALTLGVLALCAAWLLLRQPRSEPVASSSPPYTIPAANTRDDALEDLLSRADGAFSAGVLVAPPAENAADLYRKALRRNPDDARAAAGIEKVIDALVTAAEAQLTGRHFDEAQKLAQQARLISPNHVRVAFLATRIGKERERALYARARHASNPAVEQAQAGTQAAPPTDDRPLARSGSEPAAQPAATAVPQLTPQAVAAPIPEPMPQPVPQSEPAAALQPAPQPAPPLHQTVEPPAANTAATVESPMPASALQQTRYAPPVFPVSARERGLSGWVDIDFIVKADGSVSSITVSKAEPAGVFERAAIDAVRKWHYRPVLRDGHPVDQRARLRMRFALEG